MRMPFPVDPSLLLMLITMFAPSWGVSRQGERWSVGVGDGDGVAWKCDVSKTGEESKASRAMMD